MKNAMTINERRLTEHMYANAIEVCAHKPIFDFNDERVGCEFLATLRNDTAAHRAAFEEWKCAAMVHAKGFEFVGTYSVDEMWVVRIVNNADILKHDMIDWDGQ